MDYDDVMNDGGGDYGLNITLMDHRPLVLVVHGIVLKDYNLSVFKKSTIKKSKIKELEKNNYDYDAMYCA